MSKRTVRLSPESAAQLRVAAWFGLSAIFPRKRYPATVDECVRDLVDDYRRRLDAVQ